jgi:hypothetical protein
VTSLQVTWNPLVQQASEPDTLYLLDPDQEALLTSGLGGLLMANQGGADDRTPWEGGTKMQVTTGKYLKGLESLDATYGWAWMPMIGLIPGPEGTIEFWIKRTGSWATAAGAMVQVNMAADERIRFGFTAGSFTVDFEHEQDPAARVDRALAASVTAKANDSWVNFALTWRAGTINLYVDGVLADTETGAAMPVVWGDAYRQSGLGLCGSGGVGTLGMVLSDLRISRYARTPGVPLTVSDANTITVSPATVTGTTEPKLRGVLHLIGNNVHVGDAATKARLAGVVTLIRTDKFLNATPIKAGATDATHPTLGHSGLYSYDWQVVDRTLDYIASLGMTPYLSIDSTPQILGGANAPFSGTNLTSGLAYLAAFNKQVPTDFAAMATIAADFVHYVAVTRGTTVPYWGVWNEPDGAFWAGTPTQYFQLYEAIVDAVKAAVPSAVLGGPELAGPTVNGLTWIKGLIDYCAANTVALDFIPYHAYDSNPATHQRMKALIARWSAAAGIPTPPLVCSEWGSHDRLTAMRTRR